MSLTFRNFSIFGVCVHVVQWWTRGVTSVLRWTRVCVRKINFLFFFSKRNRRLGHASDGYGFRKQSKPMQHESWTHNRAKTAVRRILWKSRFDKFPRVCRACSKIAVLHFKRVGCSTRNRIFTTINYYRDVINKNKTSTGFRFYRALRVRRNE